MCANHKLKSKNVTYVFFPTHFALHKCTRFLQSIHAFYSQGKVSSTICVVKYGMRLFRIGLYQGVCPETFSDTYIAMICDKYDDLNYLSHVLKLSLSRVSSQLSFLFVLYVWVNRFNWTMPISTLVEFLFVYLSIHTSMTSFTANFSLQIFLIVRSIVNIYIVWKRFRKKKTFRLRGSLLDLRDKKYLKARKIEKIELIFIVFFIFTACECEHCHKTCWSRDNRQK